MVKLRRKREEIGSIDDQQEINLSNLPDCYGTVDKAGNRGSAARRTGTREAAGIYGGQLGHFA